MRILVTGGAGFVGSNVCRSLKSAYPEAEVTALDNLKRRGSEYTLALLKGAGVAFLHGDIRVPDDIAEAGTFDLLIECSAEPSVRAGYDSSPNYLVHTNLTGTTHCLEAARRHGAGVIFLSSSRVYPVAPLRALPLAETGERLDIPEGESGTGWSHAGIAEDFPLAGVRTLYGATKLCSEHLLTEFAATYGLKAVINSCGVIAGPWQMGKVDQGFITYWVARHLFGGDLRYTGFGGQGLQVRDALHISDLTDLLRYQIEHLEALDGEVFNAGGGREVSVSLRELTALCRERSGREIDIPGSPETGAYDIPYYVTDNARVTAATGWAPQRSFLALLDEIFDWFEDNRALLLPLYATEKT